MGMTPESEAARATSQVVGCALVLVVLAAAIVGWAIYDNGRYPAPSLTASPAQSSVNGASASLPPSTSTPRPLSTFAGDPRHVSAIWVVWDREALASDSTMGELALQGRAAVVSGGARVEALDVYDPPIGGVPSPDLRWYKVHFLSGECAGRVGYIMAQDLKVY